MAAIRASASAGPSRRSNPSARELEPGGEPEPGSDRQPADGEPEPGEPLEIRRLGRSRRHASEPNRCPRPLRWVRRRSPPVPSASAPPGAGRARARGSRPPIRPRRPPSAPRRSRPRSPTAAGTGRGSSPRPPACTRRRGTPPTASGVVSLATVNSDGRLRGYRENRRYASASVVKAMLLAAELRRLKHAGRAVDSSTDCAADGDDHHLRQRGRRRDLRPGRRRRADAVAKRAGMTRFTVAGYWGNAQITAADMARFFGDLDRQFPRRFREYAKGLLGSVIESQSWGSRRRPASAGRSASRAAGCPTTRSSTRRRSCASATAPRELAIVVLTDAQPSLDVRGRDGARRGRAAAQPGRPTLSRSIGIETEPPPAASSASRPGAAGSAEGRACSPVRRRRRGRSRRAASAAPARSPQHLALELGGALAHPRDLRPGALELALELEHRLDPGQVEALLGGHPLDPAQPLDVLVGVEAGVLRRALRRDQAARLVHAQRLRVHLGELGGDRDHEHAARDGRARRSRALAVRARRHCRRSSSLPANLRRRRGRIAQQPLARVVVVDRLGELVERLRAARRVRSRGISISSR